MPIPSQAMNDAPLHSALLRILHWINALAVLGLISSGWAIFNAAPFYDIAFPQEITLGGHLTEALRWHFALMWVFLATSAALLILRLLIRRGRIALLPVTPRGILKDLVAALRLRLAHDPGGYNQVQRAAYLAALLLSLLAVLSGLALWKPVQLSLLAEALGGYEAARRVHFWTMAGISAFVVLHLAMVAVVPRTLPGMVFGATPAAEAQDQ